MGLITVVDGNGAKKSVFTINPPVPLTAWTGTAFDVTGNANVTIWCWTAPTTPWVVQVGDGSNFATQTIVQNGASGITTVTNISAVGSYSLPGYVFVQMINGVGGTFSIQGNG